ncbi:hypothetical protein [Arachidicoccus sp.]|uniref:hypothetical protein n=1 Tax=Arachidicoccus sp. TaxID=1872624 RepID=UPI003D2455DC
MTNKTKWFLSLSVFLTIVVICTPIFFYVKDFHELQRSDNPSDWAAFGDYFGGILGPIISLLTLIVTIIIAVNLSKIERRNHEEAVNSSVKPLIEIEDDEFFSSDMTRMNPSINEDFYDYSPPTKPT